VEDRTVDVLAGDRELQPVTVAAASVRKRRKDESFIAGLFENTFFRDRDTEMERETWSTLNFTKVTSDLSFWMICAGWQFVLGDT
jgi:hypothetical protein